MHKKSQDTSSWMLAKWKLPLVQDTFSSKTTFFSECIRGARKLQESSYKQNKIKKITEMSNFVGLHCQLII